MKEKSDDIYNEISREKNGRKSYEVMGNDARGAVHGSEVEEQGGEEERVEEHHCDSMQKWIF